MLYLFDLDGTLITSYRERITDLLAQGHEVAIVSNQGGVAWGFVTPVEMWAKINAALTACGLNIATTRCYVCYHDTRGSVFNDPIQAARRKPSPAMIREALAHNPQAAAQGVLFVGDRPEDEQIAQAAGVPFQWTDEFFNNAAPARARKEM